VVEKSGEFREACPSLEVWRMVILSQALNHCYSGKVQRLELRLVLSEKNSEGKRPTPSSLVFGTGDEIVQAW